jgi:hypothetical protein
MRPISLAERIPKVCDWRNSGNDFLEQEQNRRLLLFGAGNGNRTRMASLEGWNFTIKLCPRESNLPRHASTAKLFLALRLVAATFSSQEGSTKRRMAIRSLAIWISGR